VKLVVRPRKSSVKRADFTTNNKSVNISVRINVSNYIRPSYSRKLTKAIDRHNIKKQNNFIGTSWYMYILKINDGMFCCLRYLYNYHL
jgi:hypothetical protein